MLLEDRFASIRIEEMDLIVINKQTNFITSDYLRAGIKSSDSIMSTGIEVDLKLVTQILNNVNDGVDSGRCGTVTVNESSIFQVNRANAKGNVFIAISAGAFHKKRGNSTCPMPSSTTFVRSPS